MHEICQNCGLSKSLCVNRECRKCNLIRGLKQCPKCKQLLPIDLCFTVCATWCRECRGLKGAKKYYQEDLIQKAIELYESGNSLKIIGKKLGVSQGGIRKHIKKSDTFMRPAVGPRTYTLNEDYFDTINTIDKAYWLGFLATDGYVGNRAVKICLAEVDIGHLELFKQTINSEHPITTQFRATDQNRLQNAVYLEIGSIKLAAALRNLGFLDNKTFTIQPWHGPIELEKAYWRGCIDGHGWLSLNEKVLSKSELGFCGNQFMIEGFAKFTEEVTGRKPKIAPKGNIFQIQLYGLQRNLMIDYLYNVPGPALKRKQEKAMKMLSIPGLMSPNKCGHIAGS